MVSITINGADTVISELAAVVARCQRAAPAFRVVATRLRKDTLDNFRAGGMYPSAWSPSGRRTAFLARARGKGKNPAENRSPKTLIRTGTLRNSIHADSGANFAQVGTDVKYAAAHQFGVTTRPHVIRPRVKKALAFNGIVRRQVKHPGSRIPPRPFLPIDAAGNLRPDTTRFIIDTFERWITRAQA